MIVGVRANEAPKEDQEALTAKAWASFWAEEQEAPLLNRNVGFLTPDPKTAQAAVDRANKWLDLIQFDNDDYPPQTPPTRCLTKTAAPDPSNSVCTTGDEAMDRNFRVDAERTFKSAERRREMIKCLTLIYSEINDYHQGLGFVVSYLMLFFTIEEVVKIVLALNKVYVPGYFRAASVAYFRDAKVLTKMLKIKDSELHNHLSNVLMIPFEAFCSKWFVGLNIHVLTFSALADYFEAFLSRPPKPGSVPFQFNFAFATLNHLRSKLMTTKEVGKALELLRLDECQIKLTQNDKKGVLVENPIFKQIVQEAIETTNLEDLDIETLRAEALAEMAEEAEKRRQRELELSKYSDDEITFSDEDEE